MRMVLFCLFLVSCTLYERGPSSQKSCVALIKMLLGTKHLETSIEIETTFANGMLMHLLDTDDGTVGALFKKGQVPKGFSASDRWYALNVPDKMRLLDAVTAQKKTTFFDDRNIHGLTFRNSLELTFTKETKLFGKSYPAGQHQVELGQYFKEIQYGGPKDLEKLRVLELHMRGPFESALFLDDARKLIGLLKLDVPNLHLHSVAKIPFGILEERPIIASMAIANLHRRADLASEMLDILTIKNQISPYQVGDILFQGTTTPETITGVAKYFHSLALGKKTELIDEFKMGWVGLHGPGKYDDSSLWGMQFRQLLEDHKTSDLMAIIDGVQKRMLDDLDEEIAHIEKWGRGKEILDLASLHYNQDWPLLMDQAPNSIKRKLQQNNLLQLLEEASGENEAFKMLIFDWSKDPFFTGKSSELYRFQLKALEKIASIEKVNYRYYDQDLAEVIQQFLIESNIAKQVFESIGANGIL